MAAIYILDFSNNVLTIETIRIQQCTVTPSGECLWNKFTFHQQSLCGVSVGTGGGMRSTRPL